MEDRDWEYWRDDVTRRSSNEELKAEIAERVAEIKGLEMRQSSRGQATTGETFHDIVNRAGDGERGTPEPALFDEAALERQRVEGFKAMVEDSKHSPDNRLFEEMDGDRLPWAELSATAKLGYIARDAAFSGVGFEPFAEMVKDTIGDSVEAALRVVLDGQKELHAIAKLLPDDGRIEPTPLVEQVKEILDYVSALEQQEKERLEGSEKLSEGISNVLDGKPRRDQATTCGPTFHDIINRAGDGERIAPEPELTPTKGRAM
jgi:hypothetical protein